MMWLLLAAALVNPEIEQEGGLVSVPTVGETNEIAVTEFPLKATYRQACIEGWAPPPTTPRQRAIQKEVAESRRQGPRNPLRILPGMKPKKAGETEPEMVK